MAVSYEKSHGWVAAVISPALYTSHMYACMDYISYSRDCFFSEYVIVLHCMPVSVYILGGAWSIGLCWIVLSQGGEVDYLRAVKWAVKWISVVYIARLPRAQFILALDHKPSQSMEASTTSYNNNVFVSCEAW